MVVRIDRHELGPRVYICGRRCHHFVIGMGAAAVAAALRRRRLALVFVGYAISDVRDFPWTDKNNH